MIPFNLLFYINNRFIKFSLLLPYRNAFPIFFLLHVRFYLLKCDRFYRKMFSNAKHTEKSFYFVIKKANRILWIFAAVVVNLSHQMSIKWITICSSLKPEDRRRFFSSFFLMSDVGQIVINNNGIRKTSILLLLTLHTWVHKVSRQ